MIRPLREGKFQVPVFFSHVLKGCLSNFCCQTAWLTGRNSKKNKLWDLKYNRNFQRQSTQDRVVLVIQKSAEVTVVAI